MDTKVEQNPNPPKKLIPRHVGTLNKAIDMLCLMQACTNRINNYKKQIANVDADIELMGCMIQSEPLDIRANLVYLHNKQVVVYCRLLRSYLTRLASLYEPGLYDHMHFFPTQQPDSRKIVNHA